ncbi:hypothetical protein P43SY_010037 [Pythium insidiosum]|uniref:MI domain-containing protein n=1 Tax=Pythium insidiosum TaxID=114742 RepID=A0AAD5LZI7_PYTIN|nr:hypothetical protein P43SY_010037 [Pythium insidiosum]
MDSHALPPNQSATHSSPAPAAGAAAAKLKLNPTAKTFVPTFSLASAADAKPFVPGQSASAPAPTPAPAPVSSTLKPSAKEFKPLSYSATPYVPSSFLPRPPHVPVHQPMYPAPPPSAPAAIPTPASPVVEVAKPADVIAADEEPAHTDASSASSTSSAPAEPEAEVEEAPEPESAATEEAAVEAPVDEKEPEVVDAAPSKSVAAKEADAAAAADAVVAARFSYTIAQLLELQPSSFPVPPGVSALTIFATKSDKDDEAPATGKPGKQGGSRRGESSRNLQRSNSSFGEGRGRGGRGRSGRGGRNAAPEPPLEDVAPLQINEETRWKPSHAKSRLDEPVDTTESSLKEAKSILNKLSIEKFDKLSDQLIEVAVRSLEVLQGVIDMVIAKAQMEWHFSTMYAELCAKIAQTEMPAMALDENEVAQDTHKLFRKLLLSRCQKEFEVTPSKEGLEELPEDERLEKELLLKRATLGHIRFVGELFKQRMLSSRIMHQCVQRLFGDLEAPDEESLECLCKLLTTIGQTLESAPRDQAERDFIQQYYALIKQLSGDAKRLSTRVRFMLQDLLDLRKNNWVARRKETKAMTIAEVHAEAAREAKEKEKASKAANGSSRGLQRSQSMMMPPPTPPSLEKRRSSGGGASAAWKARAAAAAAANSSDPDGWETVGPARPKLVKSRSSVERAPRVPSMGRNSSDGTVARQNSFSMLDAAPRSSRKDRERSHSSSSAQGAARRSSSSSNLPEDAKSGRPRSSSPRKARQPESDAAPSLTPDAFKKKIKGIYEEFVGLRDMQEAVECVTALQTREHDLLLATELLNTALEKGAAEREATAELLAGLYERELLAADALATAVHELLEFAEDMEIDIPHTIKYIAEMIAPSVATKALPLSRVSASAEHLVASGKAAKLVAATLSFIADEEKVKAALVEFELQSVLPEEQRNAEGLEALCKAHQLEFLL